MIKVDTTSLASLVDGTHSQPHQLLGAHADADGVTVRVLRPDATEVDVVVGEQRFAMQHEYSGVWVTELPMTTVPDYRLAVSYGGDKLPADDPYRFLPTLGEIDQHLISEGRHEQLWEVLGAHAHIYESPHGPVQGVAFAVWAPNAQGVRVVGDFNYWNGTSTPMRSLGSSGVWEVFVPEIGPGTRYKYEIIGRDGVRRLKADPMAQATEVPPATASVVFSSDYRWADSGWMTERAVTPAHAAPMSIYEVHLGSWRQGLSYQQLAEDLTDYVVAHGFTHVELLPVMEHPFGGSWGYQVSAYYAPTARFGNPDDFRHLVDRLHQAGVGVIVDWVPAHFPKDEFALARFDGTPLYEHADPRRGEHPDWGTYVFDFGRPEVRNFLVANAVYWCHEFHIDGLRVDAVASMLYLDYSRNEGEWVPNVDGGNHNYEAISLLKWTNEEVYGKYPHAMTIAEESTAFAGVSRPTFLGGLGFGFKWNMGWMHDTLTYMQKEPIHRRYHHNDMTFSMVYHYDENFILSLSHDEVVHGKHSMLYKMPGDEWQQAANLRAYMGFMYAHPGKKLNFMGTEIAQSNEWNHDAQLPWHLLQYPKHAGQQRLIHDLNHLYRHEPALYQADYDQTGFRWLDHNDADNSIFAWLRADKEGKQAIVVACNFTPVPRLEYRVGVPAAGHYRVVLNTDSEYYWGSNYDVGLVFAAEPTPWQGMANSIVLDLPPLATLFIKQES